MSSNTGVCMYLIYRWPRRLFKVNERFQLKNERATALNKNGKDYLLAELSLLHGNDSEPLKLEINQYID